MSSKFNGPEADPPQYGASPNKEARAGLTKQERPHKLS